MGGSAAETPTPSEAQPAVGGGLRASDADREQVAARLRDEYVAGRLSHETFVHRMHAVLESRHQSELPPLLADLPARQPTGGQPSAGQPSGTRSLLGRLRAAWPRKRWPAGAGQLVSSPGTVSPGTVSPGAISPGTGSPGTVSPDRKGTPGPVAAGPVSQGRRVTVGMQAAAGESPPLSLRFPRGGGDEFSIGRDAECDLAIPDMTVSRRHATLERRPEGWVLTDLASTNGTRVNGWRVRGTVPVRAGDLVTFGNAETVLIREDE